MSLLSEDREPFRLPSVRGMADLDESDLFSFAGSVGPNGDNRREDVIKAQILLGNSGDYDLAALGAPTGWPGGELYRGIKRYQKRKGAEADGLLLPLGPNGVDRNGVGETLAALQSDLGETLSGYGVPTPQQVDNHYEARARRMQAGDEAGGETSAPYSEIAVAGADGSAKLPLGVLPGARAEPPQALQSVSPSLGLTVRETGPLADKPNQQLALMNRRDDLLQGRGRMLPEGGWIPGGGGPRGAAPNPQPQSLPPGPAQRTPLPAASPLETDKAKWNAPVPPWGLFEPQRKATAESAAPPDPAQPEEDKQQADAVPAPRRGRIVIAEDGRELTVPPLDPWADKLDERERKFADSFHDQLAVEMLHRDGPRGSALTQQQLRIIADACTQVAVDMLPEFDVKHVAGTYDKAGKPVSEEQMWIYDKDGNRLPSGFRRPDFSIRLARGVAFMLRGNSYDSYADGRPKPREQNAKDAIQDMSPDEPFAMIRKFKPAPAMMS